MKRFLMAAVAMTMIFALAAGVSAKSNIGLMGVGAKVGYVDPGGGWGSTLGFAGLADLGTIMPKLALEAEVMYWKKTYSEAWYTDNYEVSFSEFIVSALGKYYFSDKKSDFKPYAGGGLSMIFWSSKIGTGIWGGGDTSGSDFAITVLGGAKKALSPKLDGFAEFRYSTSDWDFWGVFAGIVYKLK